MGKPAVNEHPTQPERYRPSLAPAEGLDPGIERIVNLLRSQGIETYESCEGTPGHCFLEPTVRFFGGQFEGYRAVSAALMFGLKPAELRRAWVVIDGELTGPHWELTFVTEEPSRE